MLPVLAFKTCPYSCQISKYALKDIFFTAVFSHKVWVPKKNLLLYTKKRPFYAFSVYTGNFQMTPSSQWQLQKSIYHTWFFKTQHKIETSSPPPNGKPLFKSSLNRENSRNILIKAYSVLQAVFRCKFKANCWKWKNTL